MRTCPRCRTSAPTDARFCTCGAVMVDTGGLDPLPGSLLGGRYLVAQRLGLGGFGAVYLATDRVLNDRPCVVKVARPELASDPKFQARFLRERDVMSRLSGEFTADIRDFGTLPDGTGFLVQEFIDGLTLADFLKKRGGRLDAPTAIDVGRGVALALREAHAKGVVHRDLKPSNVMIQEGLAGPRVKVIDFGIAGLLAGAEGEPLTRSRDVFCTLVYASPEQCRGQRAQIDQRTDLYGLGCLLYEMLAGQPPYFDRVPPDAFDNSQAHAIELVAQKLRTSPTPLARLPGPADVPMELEWLVLRLLSLHPEDRPASAAEAMERLDGIRTALAAGGGAQPKVPTSPTGTVKGASGRDPLPPPPPPAGSGLTAWKIGLVVASGVLLAVLGYLAFTGGTSSGGGAFASAGDEAPRPVDAGTEVVDAAITRDPGPGGSGTANAVGDVPNGAGPPDLRHEAAPAPAKNGADSRPAVRGTARPGPVSTPLPAKVVPDGKAVPEAIQPAPHEILHFIP